MSRTKYTIQWLHLVAMSRTKSTIQWPHIVVMAGTKSTNVSSPSMSPTFLLQSEHLMQPSQGVSMNNSSQYYRVHFRIEQLVVLLQGFMLDQNERLALLRFPRLPE